MLAAGYTLWRNLENMVLDRILAIQSEYFAENPNMTTEQRVAWDSVMSVIENIFAMKDELFGFFDELRSNLNSMFSWMTNKISSISTLAALGEDTVFQVGDSSGTRTVWSFILAPIQLIPKVGGTLNAVANGVVTVATSDARLVPNPALQAIQGTTSAMQSNLADSIATIVTEINKYRSAACGDYGKLCAMHDLLATPGAPRWDDVTMFDPASLTALEIEIWKPIMAAGWGIQIPSSGTQDPNSWIDVSERAAFDVLMASPSPKCLSYDQVSDFQDRGEFFKGYSARCRLIGNNEGSIARDDCLEHLFEKLMVPRGDVFDGRNGWALGVNDGTNKFHDRPFAYVGSEGGRG